MSEHSHNQADTSQRLPEDDLGYYHRYEIDRDSIEMAINFSQAFGADNAPYAAAKTALKTRGEVAVLDAGCGSGKTLYQIHDGLSFPNDQSRVTAVGVNSEDFSNESVEWRVRKACGEGPINYLVANIETLPLADDSFDVVYSYEVFQHNDKPDALLAELVRVLKPGASLFFNSDPTQDGYEALQQKLAELSGAGHSVRQNVLEKQGQERQFVHLSKPEK